MQEKFYNLIEDQGNVPDEYLQSIGEIKRVLERWTIDDGFRQNKSIEEGLISINSSVTIEEIFPFIDKAEAIELRKKENRNEDHCYPQSVRQYRHFIKEKMGGRQGIRKNIEPDNPKFRSWRKRQINRCIGELGPIKAEGLVHAPVAFELSKGCSVGCWFCAVSSHKLESVWKYNTENKELWREGLIVLKKIIGECIKYGVCYWATEPFDCPDYENFIEDFTHITGRCPQTTTAVPDRNIERTRKFLKLTEQLKGGINRFSINSLDTLNTIHENFSARDLTYIELIPLNLEASSQYKKANAGRARLVKNNSDDEILKANVQDEDNASTIACISGFIINMVDKSIELITPCPASNKWPTGYWVLCKEHFTDAHELSTIIQSMIDKHMTSELPLTQVIKFRKDLNWTNDPDEKTIEIASKYLLIKFKRLVFTEEMFKLISEEKHFAYQIALTLEKQYNVDLSLIMLQMTELYEKGLFDEEP